MAAKVVTCSAPVNIAVIKYCTYLVLKRTPGYKLWRPFLQGVSEMKS